MSTPANCFRVKATVTYTGEWFVPVDDDVASAEEAMEYVRSIASDEQPENLLENPHVYIVPSEVFLTDQYGLRIAESSSSVPPKEDR